MDRVASVTQAASATTTSCAYAPDGARYRQVVSGGGESGHFGPKTVYYVDKDYELSVWNGATEERSYVGGAVVYVKNGARAVRYQHLDRLGSLDAVTADDAAATEVFVDAHGYDPWGKPRGRDWSSSADRLHPNGDLPAQAVTTDREFTGHEHLDVHYLIHMNGRVYDYRLGRFLSVDPIISNPVNPQAVNPYSYIGNNPLSGVDPTGYLALVDGGQEHERNYETVLSGGWKDAGTRGSQTTSGAVGATPHDQNAKAGQAVIAASRSNGGGTVSPRPGSPPHETGSPGQLAQGAAISTGTQAASDAAVRARYEEAASKLDQNDPTASQQRRLLRTEARGQTSPAGAVIAEEMRPAGDAPRPGGRVATTNSTVNTTMEVAGKAGAVLMVVGAGVTVYNIASAPEGQTARVAAQEGGAWAGALSFGAAGGGMGAKAGAGVGVWFGGAGAVPGAAIGGVVGSVVGGAYGAYLGRQAADNVYDMTTRP